jgi:hypothetical protein
LLAGTGCGDDPVEPSEELVIAAAGDIAVCGSVGTTGTADVLGMMNPDLILTLGDNVYDNGTALEFADCYEPTWGRQKARTRPSPGNHDYNTPDAAPYFAYFGAAAGPAGLGYYSFDAGGWHLISLNSNVPAGAGSAQLDWLREDLRQHPATCTLAYWHHPVITSGQHGNNPHMQEVWRVLDSAAADLILVGHDHDYERFAPQTETGAAGPDGVRQFVVGTGGAELRDFATIQANSEMRNSTSWGVLRLVLRADRYDWEFVPAPGATFTDQGSATCGAS